MKYFLFFTFLLSSVFSNAQPYSDPRSLVHILEYLSNDYAGAVENGKITNPAEHKEHLELVESAQKILMQDSKLNQQTELINDFSTLQNQIKTLASTEKIKATAIAAKQKIISITHLQMAPASWPSLTKGKLVFETNCSSCHGLTGAGNGPGAEKLNPPPANFLSEVHAHHLSPSNIFNTARVGIEGTAMTHFDKINDDDLWAVAFYIMSLKHPHFSQDLNDDWKNKLTLEEVSTLSDAEILKKLGADNNPAVIASVRNFSGKSNVNDFIAFTNNLLFSALEDYKNERFELAQNKALKAYLEGVEPIEPKIKAKNPSLLRQVENQMMELRQKMAAKQPFDEIQNQTHSCIKVLVQTKNLLNESSSSPAFTFFLTLSIILREALEALLVIIALLGVIRATGAKKAERWLHSGWVTAVGLGVALWFFSGWILNLSGASRELLEGTVSLIAVCILLYVGFWLHSKTEIGKWNTFIKSHIENTLGKGNLMGLAFISFTAVAREAIEVVLFLRTIWIDTVADDASKAALILGVFASFFFVILLAWVLLKYSAKVPVKKLFTYSSMIIGFLAFSMIGKALHSIQEAGKISITSVPFNFRNDLLGFYPTLETLTAQIVMILLLVVLWNLGRRPKLSNP